MFVTQIKISMMMYFFVDNFIFNKYMAEDEGMLHRNLAELRIGIPLILNAPEICSATDSAFEVDKFKYCDFISELPLEVCLT
jgi:hypothetical protein